MLLSSSLNRATVQPWSPTPRLGTEANPVTVIAKDASVLFAGGSSGFDVTGGVRPAPLGITPATASAAPLATSAGQGGSFGVFAGESVVYEPMRPKPAAPVIGPPEVAAATAPGPLTFRAWLRSLFARRA
jgi:hypothetical protein